jgi:hypothetical protein
MKACKSIERYGQSDPECSWEFKPKSNNEQFCDACKPLCARLRQNIAQMKYDRGGVPRPKDLDFPWTASHIDKECHNCGRKGVPIQNRMLCVVCYTGDQEYSINYESSWLPEILENEVPSVASSVTHYTGLTQEEFRAILNNERS